MISRLKKGTFDLITLLDVLEHIENDGKAIDVLMGLLKPGGYLVLTVPAFQFLWSRNDFFHHHYRRYSLPELTRRVKGHGSSLTFISYFNTFLFPLIALLRFILPQHSKQKNPIGFSIPPRPLNAFLKWLFSSEKYLLGRVRFPFGVSILACVEKSTGARDEKETLSF